MFTVESIEEIRRNQQARAEAKRRRHAAAANSKRGLRTKHRMGTRFDLKNIAKPADATAIAYLRNSELRQPREMKRVFALVRDRTEQVLCVRHPQG